MLGRNSVGQIIDSRFEILEILGSGGMGNVYKARQIGLGRILALKILHAAHLADSDSRARFEREGKVLSQFAHRHIITFYRFGIHQALYPYIAMEYLEGKSLRDLLADEEKLEWRRVIRVGIQVCEAMQYAHDRHVVHRDLKPENIMLLADPEPDFVKVVDFGLAKRAAQSPSPDQKLTQTGALVGSVHYLSPEQCLGKVVDSRSDIYALGCVLYECLVGEPPQAADNPMGLIYKHVNEAPRAFSSFKNCKELPAELEYVLFKAMEKDPDSRYQKMSEFCDDLKRVLTGKADEITASKPPVPVNVLGQTKKNGLVILLALLLTTFFIMLYFYDPVIRAVIIGITDCNKNKTQMENRLAAADTLNYLGRPRVSLEVYRSVADSPEPDGLLSRVEALTKMTELYQKLELGDGSKLTMVRALKLLNREMLSTAPDDSRLNIYLPALLRLYSSSSYTSSAEVIYVLDKLLRTCKMRGDRERVLSIYRAKAGAFERRYGKHSLEYWLCLLDRSLYAASFGYKTESRSLYQSIVDDMNKSKKKQDLLNAEIENRIGTICYLYGDKEEASIYGKKAENTFRRLIIEDSSEKDWAYFALSMLEFIRKNPEKAEVYYKAGKKITAQRYGHSTDFYMGRCCEMAYQLHVLGYDKAAEKILKDLLLEYKLQVDEPPPLRAGRVNTYLNVGSECGRFLFKRKLYAQTQILLGRIVRRKEMNPITNKESYYDDLLALGEAAWHNGDLNEAFTAFHKAEVLIIGTPNWDTYPDMAHILNAEASIEEARGNKEEAAELRKRCQELAKKWNGYPESLLKANDRV